MERMKNSSVQLDSLINTVLVFNQDIGMKFGIQKCGVVIMKRRIFVEGRGLMLSNGQPCNEADR